jgi:hypothetical protein
MCVVPPADENGSVVARPTAKRWSPSLTDELFTIPSEREGALVLAPPG